MEFREGARARLEWPNGTYPSAEGIAVLKGGQRMIEVDNGGEPAWWAMEWQDDRKVIYLEDADPVNHPAHYTSYKGVEVIQLTEQMNFNRGNAVKYIARAGLKVPTREAEIEDLKKARWYIEREITRLEATP
jgi:Protein of unknwon function (DUF3310)